MNFAGLVRLSFEVREGTPEGEALYAQMVADLESGKRRVLTGKDINGRDTQESDLRSFVESRGGTYVHTYSEPDTSAWKRRRVTLPDGTSAYRVVRPKFQAMLEDLKRGVAANGERLDGIAVVNIDRLTRENRTLEDAIDTVDLCHRPIIDLSGTLDLLTEEGRVVAKLLVAAKNAESAATSRRVERKHRALEQAGIPTGGGRSFGWQADKRTLNEPEARELRRAVDRLLSGTSLTAITSDWIRRGVPNVRGGTWKRNTIRMMLRNPRMCGLRGHTVIQIDPATETEQRFMQVVTDDQTGQPVIGLWEPMISVEKWHQLLEVIGDGSPDPAKRSGGGRNSRKYLLPGTLRCGKCHGRKVRAAKRPGVKSRPEGFFYYQCPSTAQGGCGGVTIDGPETDKAVSMAVIAWYEKQAVGREDTIKPEPWPGVDDLKRVKEDMDALKARRRAGKISADSYFEHLAEYEDERDALITQRTAWERAHAIPAKAPDNLRQRWDDYGPEGLSLAEKREYISGALNTVVMNPADYRSQPVRERLEFFWRTQL